MNTPPFPLYAVTADTQVLDILRRYLPEAGYSLVHGTDIDALLADDATPAGLIIIDGTISDERGLDLCRRLQADERTAYVPVLYLSPAKDEFCSKMQAFTSGISDIIAKPLQFDVLLRTLERNRSVAAAWARLTEDAVMRTRLAIIKDAPSGGAENDISSLRNGFNGFKDMLAQRRPFLSAGQIASLNYRDIFTLCGANDLSDTQMARLISEYTGLPYIDSVMPHQIQFGVLPPRFCMQSLVIPFVNQLGQRMFMFGNPFDWETLELLRINGYLSGKSDCVVSEPAILKRFAQPVTAGEPRAVSASSHSTAPMPGSLQPERLSEQSTPALVDTILERAVQSRATDIHIDPKACCTLIRFRIDGDLHDAVFLDEPSTRIIARLKAIGGMDIVESRRPQDGALEFGAMKRRFNARLATTSTPHGESMKIRLLEPDSVAKDLMDLGMNKDQCKAVDELTARTAGMLLLVGPAGTGKTTTSYGLLAHLNYQSRGIISVEDPIEYRIPFADQQQVNEKAGITYDVLLKAAVRQDPDVLFIGEIRDQDSARIAIDFTSTGHLTISTMHTTNATTAVFRLERLGINRGVMADNIIGIVAQRLLKCLCPRCKTVRPLTLQEQKMLEPFSCDIPKEAAYPVGCPYCKQSGHFGRTGVYEIVPFGPEIAEMVRRYAPIADIRKRLSDRGDYLITHHAIDKVRNMLCSPAEVYSRLLVEELPLRPGAECGMPKDMPTGEPRRPSILLIEWDRRIYHRLTAELAMRGYDVQVTPDGIDAIVRLAAEPFELVISDMSLPGMEGYKLLELMHQKGVYIPVLFMVDEQGKQDELPTNVSGRVEYVVKPIIADEIDQKIQGLLSGL